jgi:hypothetical protein
LSHALKRVRSRLTLAALTVTTLATAGCDLVSLSFDGSSGLVVVVVSDGDGPSRRYRVRASQEGHPDQTVEVTPGRELRLPVTGSEPVELTLLLPDGCGAISENPQVVTPSADSQVRATFAAECD